MCEKKKNDLITAHCLFKPELTQAEQKDSSGKKYVYGLQMADLTHRF